MLNTYLCLNFVGIIASLAFSSFSPICFLRHCVSIDNDWQSQFESDLRFLSSWNKQLFIAQLTTLVFYWFSFILFLRLKKNWNFYQKNVDKFKFKMNSIVFYILMNVFIGIQHGCTNKAVDFMFSSYFFFFICLIWWFQHNRFMFLYSVHHQLK